MDTTQASHISHLGYPRPTTPHLDALATEGVTFERAYATSTWTAPSHASLFTGRYPGEHGCHMRVDAKREIPAPLSDGVRTLAEVLSEQGYSTAGIIGGPFLSGEMGFARGFDLFDDRIRGRKRPATIVNSRAQAWLEERGDKPFFLFLNYFDAHGPYDPPIDLHYPFGNPPEPRSPSYRSFSPGVYKREKREMPSEEEIPSLVERYDQCIFAADSAMGEFFAYLQERGLWEKTVILVTGDHGEAFGDQVAGRTLWGHGLGPHEVMCHVPLVIRFPGAGPHSRGRVKVPTSNLRVPGTLLRAVGIEEPGFPGLDLDQLLAGGEDLGVIAERHFPGSWFGAYWKGDFKLLRSMELDPPVREWLVFLGKKKRTRRVNVERLLREGGLSPRRRQKGLELYESLKTSWDQQLALREEFAMEMGIRNRKTNPFEGGTESTRLSRELKEKLRALGYLNREERRENAAPSDPRGSRNEKDSLER